MSTGNDSGDQGRLTRATLNSILIELGRVVALNVIDAQLIKFTNNAVFRLVHAPVVVRIAGSNTMRQRVPKVVQVARWLEEQNIPAVRLLPHVSQPLEIQNHLVTLWQEAPTSGSRPTGVDLGGILRKFHALTAPSFALPTWKPIEEIRQRLSEPEGVSAADLGFLLGQCDELEQELGNLNFILPIGPIHGDAFLGNLVSGPAGSVICDFDSTSIGPREWDLTPIAVGKLRFDYPGNAHGELVESYGLDVTEWEGFSTFRQVRELKLVTSVVPVLRSNPDIREQWAYRLATFRRRDMAAKWTTY